MGTSPGPESLATGLVVEETPSHDGTRCVAVWLSVNGARDRPKWAVRIYDTTPDAGEEALAFERAIMIHEGTLQYRHHVGPGFRDRIEVHGLPMPDGATSEQRAAMCIAHNVAEIAARNATGSTDFFIPGTYSEGGYQYGLVILERLAGDWVRVVHRGSGGGIRDSAAAEGGGRGGGGGGGAPLVEAAVTTNHAGNSSAPAATNHIGDSSGGGGDSGDSSRDDPSTSTSTAPPVQYPWPTQQPTPDSTDVEDSEGGEYGDNAASEEEEEEGGLPHQHRGGNDVNAEDGADGRAFGDFLSVFWVEGPEPSRGDALPAQRNLWQRPIDRLDNSVAALREEISNFYTRHIHGLLLSEPYSIHANAQPRVGA